MGARSTATDAVVRQAVRQRAERPTVFVRSSRHLIAHSLIGLLRRYGLSAHADAARPYDVVLCDVDSSGSVQKPTLRLVHESDDFSALIERGYQGYIELGTTPRVLLKALEAVYRGEFWMDREVLTTLLQNPPKKNLTAREREVMHLVVQGLSNRQVAERLSISENTVKSHLTRLYRKLSAHSRVQLMLRARSA